MANLELSQNRIKPWKFGAATSLVVDINHTRKLFICPHHADGLYRCARRYLCTGTKLNHTGTALSNRRIEVGDRSNDRATIRIPICFTFIKQAGKNTLDPPQICDPAPRVLKPSSGNVTDAEAVCAVLELEQGFDLLQAEAERLCTLDEADAVDMRRTIAPIGTDCLPRLRHQTAALVVSYGFDADARGFSNLADCEVSIPQVPPLDSVLKYGLYTRSTMNSMSWKTP